MRQLVDELGRRWFVAVGKQSYGALVLLFDRRGATDVRECQLEAPSRVAAERELAALDETQLLEHLHRARPWGDDTNNGP